MYKHSWFALYPAAPTFLFISQQKQELFPNDKNFNFATNLPAAQDELLKMRSGARVVVEKLKSSQCGLGHWASQKMLHRMGNKLASFLMSDSDSQKRLTSSSCKIAFANSIYSQNDSTILFNLEHIAIKMHCL